MGSIMASKNDLDNVAMRFNWLYSKSKNQMSGRDKKRQIVMSQCNNRTFAQKMTNLMIPVS